MSELVALHTQALREPVATQYLRGLAKALAAARINKSFPDRRGLEGTLKALELESHLGLYDSIYVDSRAGLPNMASLTRVLSDRTVGRDALATMEDGATLEARRGEAEVFERLARKRRYFELLGKLELAPVDSHRVLLRRHEPEQSRASFRVELTKVVSSGCYVRVVIELVQAASIWAHKLVEVDAHGEVAAGTDALRGMVYRLANFDAETLIVRMHELEGVHVERVQRGIVGPVLWAIPTDDGLCRVLEPAADALGAAWHGYLTSTRVTAPQFVVAFASDTAAGDVPVEASNDPLVPLLGSQITETERARYGLLRQRHPFRVYKDRKFVVTDAVRPLVEQLCRSAGTKNLVYPLR